MDKRFVVLLTLLLFSSIILLIGDYYLLGTIYFYVALSFVFINVISSKKVKLLDVWNVGFLFIILSEIFLSTTIDNSYLTAIKFLLIANNMINAGYHSLSLKKPLRLKVKNKKIVIRNKKITVFWLLAFLLFYFLLNIQDALYTFAVGRNVVISEGSGSGFFLDSILNAIGFVLPSILGYYFTFVLKKSAWFPLLLSLPIFTVLFLGGTRFPLMFSMLGLLIVLQAKYLGRMSMKHYTIIISSVLLLAYTGTLMKHLRSSTTRESEFTFVEDKPWKDFPTFISDAIMSPEGVIDMTNLLFNHFSRNDHLYGSSSSFILYFWVPREVWPNKPTMLGHWFIREYRSGFAEGHSASFGFTGDLYADFGLLSLLFVFFLGRMLKYAENFKSVAFKKGGYSLILGAMLFPYVFFFVRSPITATMTFLGIIFFYQMFKRLIFIK